MLRKFYSVAAISSLIVAFGAMPARGMSLEEAISVAVASNPQIGEAIYNREAVGFQLRQARGLFLPRIDGELRTGRQRYTTPATIPNGLEDDFRPNEVRIVGSQRVFDGFAALSEMQRQAARLDSAAHRVFERSEFIALAVAREYIDIVRLRTLLQSAQRNLVFHQGILGDVTKGAQGGALSVADQQQAQERFLAAQIRIQQLRDDLVQAESRFIQLVGLPIGATGPIPIVRNKLPATLDIVLGIARRENPLLKIRNAELDAQLAQIRNAESVFYPRINAEVSANRGNDRANIQGRTEDYRAELVARWNIFNGGIDVATREEQVRRASELRMAISTAHREVENEARISWERRIWLRQQSDGLRRQLQVSRELLRSYQEQFRIGSRSLLDLLDTQNSSYATEAALLTAQHAEIFSEYRLLASMGQLIKTFKVKPSKATEADNRVENFVPQTPPSETMFRSHGDPWFEIR